MTIVADLYPARERGKVQGYLASVWAFSAIVGPVAGGAIIRGNAAPVKRLLVEVDRHTIQFNRTQ